MIYENQIKGLVAICLILAVIPFIVFLSRSFINYQIPVFINQYNDYPAIQVINGDQIAGIYFVIPGTTANQLLQIIGIKQSAIKDFRLENGMKITINSASDKQDIVVTKITAAARLALGMPLDINQVNEDDLLLITGIGQSTAMKILDLRKQSGRLSNIEQLMEIDGIKEKRLAEIRKNLYVEKLKR